MYEHRRRIRSIAPLCCVGLLWAAGCSGGGSGPDDAGVDAATVGSPVAWYRFEGDVANDSSGLEHHAECGEDGCPRTVSSGQVGRAAAFDGTTYMTISDEDGSLSTPEGYTAAAWVKLDVLEERVGVFTKKFSTGSKNSWALTIDGDGFPFCFTSTTDANDALRANDPIETGQWYHLACSWDGTTKRFYVDGVEERSAEAQSGFDDGPIIIGGDIDDRPDFLMLGLVDEAMLFDYAIGPEDVEALANRATPVSEMP